MNKQINIIKKNSYRILFFILAAIFALCVMLTPVMREGSNVSCNPILFILGGLFFLVVTFLLEHMTSKINSQSRNITISISNITVFFICFFTIFGIGIWYLLVYYPGTGMYDTIAILTNGTILARQHPWFYCLIVEIIVKIVFRLNGNYESALVVCSIIQILITALVYSYIIIWLKKKGINTIAWFLIACFYIFCPILNLYMITQFKDIPYALTLVMWVPILYDYYESKGHNLQKAKNILIIALLILLSLLRNNGVYVTAFILIAMLVINCKQWKRIFVLIGILIMVITGSKLYESQKDISHMFKETVGIPLQQIAATVYYEGAVTDSQIDFINKVIPIEFIKENYNPYSADTLKWGGSPINNDFLNDHKLEFLKTWCELFLKNKKIYVEAYLKNTYSFWSLDNANINVKYTELSTGGWDDWVAENNLSIKSIFNAHTQPKIEDVMDKLNKPLGAGTCFWILMIVLMILVKFNNWKIIIIAVPSLGAWITLMLATPIAYQWRYILYIPMTIPILIGLLFKKTI